MQGKVRDGLIKCFGSESPKVHRIIGVPIRGSDKCYRFENGRRQGEAQCVSLAETMALANRLHASQPWIDTVLLTSEDPEALKNSHVLPELVLGSNRPNRWTILTNSDDVQQGTGSSSSVGLRVGSNREMLPSANITESVLTTLSCQILPSHHIVLLKSSRFHSGFQECIWSMFQLKP